MKNDWMAFEVEQNKKAFAQKMYSALEIVE